MKKTILLASALFTLIVIGCATSGKPNWFGANFAHIDGTNYVFIPKTNAQTGEVTVEKKAIYHYSKDPNVEANIKEGAGAVGGLWGVGGIASTAAAALYGGFITLLNHKNRKASETLAQGTEVALELFKTISPALEARYKAEIIKNQENAGTKATITKVVDDTVNENSARATANTLVAAVTVGVPPEGPVVQPAS